MPKAMDVNAIVALICFRVHFSDSIKKMPKGRAEACYKNSFFTKSTVKIKNVTSGSECGAESSR